MLRFDPATLARWKDAGVTEVAVRLVRGGCAGTKVSVEENPPSESVGGLSREDVPGGPALRFEASDRDKLEGARITGVEKSGKRVWIFSAGNVKGRCGCGTSFSFDSAFSGGSHAGKGDSDAAARKNPGTPDFSKLSAIKATFAGK